MKKKLNNQLTKKPFLIKLKKKNFYSINLVFFFIGLKALHSGYLKSKELELIKSFLKKNLKKNFKINFRGFSFLALTSKPSGVRMGKGKGEISEWVAPIKKGQILFELQSSINSGVLTELLMKLKKKISIKTKIINLDKL